MQIKFSPLFTIIFFLLYVASSNAQEKNAGRKFIAVEIKNDYAVALARHFTRYSVMHLPSAEIAALCNSQGETDISLQLGNGMVFNMKLVRSNIVSPDYKLFIKTDTGTQILSPQPDFLYKGKTKEGGDVRLGIKPGFISGSIHADDKEYLIEPVKRYAENAANDAFVFFERADLIPGTMNCGTSETGGSSNDRVEGSVCKSADIFNIADYSIYQHYGKSIEAVENFLLTNLNNVEGVYNNFNFDPADLADTGNDNIRFRIVATHIATCPSCDIVDTTNSAGSMTIQMKAGFFANLGLAQPFNFIPHFWTMRPLNAGPQLSGVTTGGFVYMRHLSDDPLYLRLVAAHETGHCFNCQHDNDAKPGVKSFIMYSAATTNATRFSQLSDFGGLYYSSNLAIKQTVLKPALFVGDCVVPACTRVKDIRINYFYNRGPRISWTGTDRVAVNYKLKDAPGYDPLTLQFSDTGSVLLNNLSLCEDYVAEVKKECNAGIYGPPDLVYFNTGSVLLSDFTTAAPVNDRFILSCKGSGYTTLLSDAVITVDHIASSFVFDSVTKILSVKNLFADGARHRIDITDHNNKRFCTEPFYFQAPYFRDSSKEVLAADFNNCGYSAGWSDTLIKAQPAQGPGYGFVFEPITRYVTFFNQGTIDSSCMASCINYAGSNGKLIFQSPETDISSFTGPMLHFDYNFMNFQSAAGGLPAGSLTVQGFDGIQWKTLYSYAKQVTIKPLGRYISVWDSIPARKFIPLDSFHNKNFKVRFVIDDGSYADSTGKIVSSATLAAFDNIRIDAYPNSSAPANETFSIFPNPAGNEIFVKSGLPVNDIIYYRIMDVVGRQYSTATLINSRINIQQLPAGIFVVQFFTNDKKIHSIKFVRH